MSWVAAAVIGSSVVGAGASVYASNQQANAAEDAGKVQQAAANAASLGFGRLRPRGELEP